MIRVNLFKGLLNEGFACAKDINELFGIRLVTAHARPETRSDIIYFLQIYNSAIRNPMKSNITPPPPLDLIVMFIYRHRLHFL